MHQGGSLWACHEHFGPWLPTELVLPPLPKLVRMRLVRSRVLQKLKGVVGKRKQQASNVPNPTYTRERERRRNRLLNFGEESAMLLYS